MLIKTRVKPRPFRQDINLSMTEIAKKRVDQVYIGDAAHPSVKPNSIDLMIIRFLNLEVLPVQVANDIFPTEPLIDFISTRMYYVKNQNIRVC